MLKRRKKFPGPQAAQSSPSPAEGAYNSGGGDKKAAELYAAELEQITQEGGRALKELERFYAAAGDEELRQRIMLISDLVSKIIKDAEADPRDIPRIKQFLSRRMPEAIRLLNEYDRMYSSDSPSAADGDRGGDIRQALDKISRDYAEQFDALFDQERLDIETEIQTLETMLKSQGLGASDFII